MNSEFGMRNSELNVSPSGTDQDCMQVEKELHNRKVEIYYRAKFDFAYNQIYREAVTIIPNSEFIIPN